MARAVMVLGTTSGAGKSWLTTALCRWYARQGLRVAPFKAQNMSNNARVVPGPGGVLGEIGSAQYFQALAAQVAPDVRMNPVLLKPESDTASQVVVMGQVRADLAAVPWRVRSEALWPHARQALDDLMHDHDLVVIEGAGSPAEINLHAQDFVNMRTARHAQAVCLLVTDIDRGGAFAHLYGTHQLLPANEQALIRGFVLNRFRGDAALLAPGPEQLRALTGVPTLAVLPLCRDHGLPEEDGLHGGASGQPAWQADPAAAVPPGLRRVAIVAGPHISNLDEFQALGQLPDVSLVWARHPRDLIGAHWVILPGSKHTRADLAWLRAQGLDQAIVAHAAQGGAVLGICGGLQIMGEHIIDPQGVEGEAGQAQGLGLLPVHTRFAGAKTVRHTHLRCQARVGTSAAAGAPPWSALHAVAAQGYEIHHGHTHWRPDAPPADAQWLDAQGQVLGWQHGALMGLYAHGLFEDAAVLAALFGPHARTLDAVFEGLADVLDRHFAPGALTALLGDPPAPGATDPATSRTAAPHATPTPHPPLP